MSKHNCKSCAKCECCDNCTYICEGDYLCDEHNVIVLEGYVIPTEDYKYCKGKDFIRR